MSKSPIHFELEDAVPKSQGFSVYSKRLEEERDSPVGKMLFSFDFNLSHQLPVLSSDFSDQTFNSFRFS